MHPLLAPPSFSTPAAHDAEHGFRFRLVQAHDRYRREAEDAVRAHREAAEQERKRLLSPHPLMSKA
jgi:hypothetical protein